jgi:capsular polysaccharide biosynthesis protein
MVAGSAARGSYSATYSVAAMDIYRALWRRRFLVAILTIATVVSAYIAVSRETKMYKTSTMVRIESRVTDPTQLSNQIGIAQHLAQTYAQIVSTYSMGNRIFRVLGGRVPRDEIEISASPIQDLELLNISAKSSDPRVAAEVANAAPVALRQFLASNPNPGKDAVITVDPAGTPGTAFSPRLKLSLIIAFVAGLVFNGGLALLIEFLSDRLPDADDMEAAFGLPVLATVPVLEFRSPDIERLQQRLASEGRERAASPRLTQPQPRRSG